MTTEHSTYSYDGIEQETVTLKRGPATPHGHALLKIEYSDGQIVDCYVSTAWLRDRANDLGEPCPLTPDADEDTSVDYHAMWWKAEREREKAEKERDEARHERDSWRAQVPLADWEKDLIQATENPRALTPDDATDAQIAAAYRAGRFDLADWLAGRTDRIAEEMNR